MSGNAGAPCTVCSHPAHKTIDNEILKGESSIADLHRNFGLSRQSLMRHRDRHIGKTVAAAVARERAAPTTVEQHGASLLEQVRDLQKKAMGLMAQAYHQRDLRTALAGVSAATKLLELQGKFLGQIDTGTTINIYQSNEFKAVTVNLVEALKPYPDAQAAVLLALAGPLIEG